MGYYIEHPQRGDKKALLEKNGLYLSSAPKSLTEIPEGKTLVCLINNGTFYAAAIMYSERELESAKYPQDHRAKYWFVVPKQFAIEHSDWEG